MTPKDREKDTIVQELFSHEHVTRVMPQKGWHMPDFKELWAYRELLLVLALRDIKVRYKQTVLGVTWAIIQPLTTMLIFTIIFGRLAKIPSEGYPYAIFVYAALLPWTFFANALSTSGNSLVGSSNLVSKIYFPRLIIPMASIGGGLVDFLFSTVILFLLMIHFDVVWTSNLLMAPLLLLGVMLTALGVGSLLSALTVSYRDFRFVVPFLIQIWMFLSPVVYGVGFIPEKWRWLLLLNPMTGYIDGFRAAFLGKSFDWTALGGSTILSLSIFVIGIAYFTKVERRFSDVI
ncbi:MAG: ABC transporter permease [Verrucomicrobia bacterium]|nr:ABC transporter permease [Verrucomicrobiota bacterium]